MTGLIPSALVLLLLAPILFSCTAPRGSTPETKGSSSVPIANTVPRVEWEQKWEAALAGAKKEGDLMVYSTLAGDFIRQLGAAFKNKYGINVDVISTRGPDLLQRMLVEHSAGLSIVDVVIAGGTNLLVGMKPPGLLGKIDSRLVLPEVVDPKAWVTGGIPYYDKERYGIGMIAKFSRYILRNTDLVKAGEINSYKDLLNSQWKGKMIMNDPSVAGGGLGFFTFLVEIWGIEEATQFMRQLVKQDLVITRDLRLQVEWVSRGKHELAVSPTPEQVAPFIQLGAPISLVKVIEGGKIGAGASGLAVSARPPHPNAATVFINWLLSREGQEILVKNIGNPGARADAPTEGIPRLLFPEPGEKFLLDTEETFLLQGEIIKVAREIFAPLSK